MTPSPRRRAGDDAISRRHLPRVRRGPRGPGPKLLREGGARRETEAGPERARVEPRPRVAPRGGAEQSIGMFGRAAPRLWGAVQPALLTRTGHSITFGCTTRPPEGVLSVVPGRSVEPRPFRPPPRHRRVSTPSSPRRLHAGAASHPPHTGWPRRNSRASSTRPSPSSTRPRPSTTPCLLRPPPRSRNPRRASTS